MTVHDETDVRPAVSTGRLPASETVAAMLSAAHQTYGPVDEGVVADYIPALASASRDLFGLAVAGVDGSVVGVGDDDHAFSIQSVSKPFVFALVCDAIGHRAARERLGVNATGLPFDSVMAVELAADGLTNPMVNAGAIATTGLVPGADGAAKWDAVLRGLSAFAGRGLAVDDDVLTSEMASNGRNEALARLVDGHRRMGVPPDVATEVYTRQCSVDVTVRDLAVMGATLADGGVNPVTGEQVVSADTSRRTLALMLTAGMYELSGDWLYEVGLPAKSGVSGALVTIAPGKGSLAAFSPPLDRAGNTVRGQHATKVLSDSLGLNLLSSIPDRARPG